MSDYPRVLALRPPRLLTGCLRAPARPGAESVRGNRMDRGRRGVGACRYISSQPPSKFGLLARSLPGSLPGRLLSHTTLRSRSKLKKNQTTVRSHTPNTNHSQIFSPHGPTTPSPHGPFKPSPAHSDATVADWSDRTKAESAFVRSYQPSTCCQMCMPFWHDTSRASHLARQEWAGKLQKVRGRPPWKEGG